jgi:hypothetical protein
VGLTPTLLFLDRLGGFWRLWRRLLGRFDCGYPTGELSHDRVVSPALFGTRLPLGVQLLPKVANLILQSVNKLWLVAWYADIGRLVRLRRTTAQQHEHRTALSDGRQRATLYPAADRTLGYAERCCGLGNG